MCKNIAYKTIQDTAKKIAEKQTEVSILKEKIA